MADITLEADIDLSGVQRQLRGADFSRLNRGLSTGERNAGNLNRTLGRTSSLVTAVGAGVAALGVGRTLQSIISTTTDFDTAMRGVAAVTGATADEFERLSTQAQDLGASTQFSASQVADAQRFLGQAGFETNEIFAATPGLLSLAAAGQLELGAAADIASNVLSGFNLDAAETARVSDVLAQAAASSNTNVQQLGDAFRFVGPVAANLGVSVEETAAAIGVLSDAGIQGGMAGTNLRATILRLVNPTKDATLALQEAGIQATDSNGNFVGLSNVIEQVARAMEDGSATTQDLATIFGTEAVSGVLALASASERLGVLQTTLEGSEGAAMQMAETLQSGPQGAINSFRSAVEGLQIALGQSGLVDVFVSITESVTAFTRSLTSLVSGDINFQEFINELLGVSEGETVFGNLVSRVQNLGQSLRDALFSALGGQQGQGFGEVLSQTFNNLRESATEVLNNIDFSALGMNLANTVIDFVSNIDWGSVFRFTGAVLTAVLDFAAGIGGALLDGIVDAFSGLGDIVVEAARAGINNLIGVLETSLNNILLNIPDIILPASLENGVTFPRLQNGGFVRGPGSGTSDSILARISNGEFVVNARATRNNLDLLTAINSGRNLPRFQRGGLAGDTNFDLRTEVRDAFEGGLRDAIRSGNFENLLSGVFDTVAQTFVNRLTDLAASQLTNAIFGNASGAGGLGSLFGGIFQDGGVVPGRGPVPIIAHGGEVVLNRGQQEALLQGGAGNNVTINVSGNVDDRAINQIRQVVQNSPRQVGSAGSVFQQNTRGLNRRAR